MKDDPLTQAVDQNPAVALVAIRNLRRSVDDVEGLAVSRARSLGYSWAAIGRLLGRSKQGLWEKYRTDFNDA